MLFGFRMFIKACMHKWIVMSLCQASSGGQYPILFQICSSSTATDVCTTHPLVSSSSLPPSASAALPSPGTPHPRVALLEYHAALHAGPCISKYGQQCTSKLICHLYHHCLQYWAIIRRGDSCPTDCKAKLI